AAGDAARRRVGLHLRVRRGARVGDAAAHAERAAPQGRPALHARRRRGVRAVAAHVVAGPDGPRGRGVPPALHRLLTGGEPRPRPGYWGHAVLLAWSRRALRPVRAPARPAPSGPALGAPDPAVAARRAST